MSDKVPSAIAIVASAFDKALDAKPLKDGSVKVPLAIGKHNLNGKRVKAEKMTKGEMKDTLDRVWWNLRWKYRKADDGSVAPGDMLNGAKHLRYDTFVKLGRMPLVNIKGKAYIVLTAEDRARIAE